MAFLQPALLYALPAVLIPLIIHLLHRRRFQEKSWGAMRFLREALEEKRGRRKVRHWIVLAMRMLAVAMLIVAMSRPLIGGWLAGWAGSGDRSITIVMDRSASMERKLPGGLTKREIALHTLTETLSQVNPSEVWLLDQPLHKYSNLATQFSPTDAKADLPAMLMKAFQNWTRTQQTNGEIWIASDLQATSWRAEDAAAWADVEAAYSKLDPGPTLRVLSIQGGKPNRSIRCEMDQRQLIVTIQQETAATQTIPVTLKQGDQTTNKDVTLSGKTTTLTLDMPSEGVVIGELSLPEDGNARDNTTHFVFANETRPTVAIVCENPNVEALLSLAVSPTSAVDITREATWQDEALIIWQGRTPDTNEMDAYLAEGGQLLVLPDEQADTKTSEPGLPIMHWSQDEGPLRDTRSGESLPLHNLRTFRHTSITGDALASLATAPWLSKENDTYFLATLPLTSWSTLGEGPVLLPLVQRLLTEGQKRFSQVHVRGADQAPWQAGIWPNANGWDITARPVAEDDPKEALISSLGNLPFQEFAMEAKPQGNNALNEWWRPILFLGLLFLLAEGLLTRMPSPKRSVTSAA